MLVLSEEIKFDEKASGLVGDKKYGRNWPVNYIIYNDSEAYVGETTDMASRISEHLRSNTKKGLLKFRFLASDKYNKSSALDLEAFLISHMDADGLFKLRNGNGGLQNHDYYQRKELYEATFEEAWAKLKKAQLVRSDIRKIEEDSFFRYSPYKALNSDQHITITNILCDLADNIKDGRKRTFLVKGGPGTGKTVLGIYLMKLLATTVEEENGLKEERLVEALQIIREHYGEMKIGFVLPTPNLRNVLQLIFGKTKSLKSVMILNPSQVARSKEIFDFLIVDEAHRLKRRSALSGPGEYGTFDENNKILGLKDGTQLDWILKKSRNQILFYDEWQSVKPADVGPFEFERLKDRGGYREYELKIQMRCLKGGDKYIEFIKDVINGEALNKKYEVGKGYDFRVFDDVDEMIKLVRKKDNEVGLCRNVAGFAWPWKTKGRVFLKNLEETEECIKKGMFDIEIDKNRYIWNTNVTGWVRSENAVNEIGCIHTIQGFDLNYAGVIIGGDLKYDEERNKIYVDGGSYYDKTGKMGVSDEELADYIKRIYMVLCTRGALGTYIYAVDEGMRRYLKRCMNSIKNR